MKRRAEDGRRVISMETLGEYRPKRMGPQLKEYEEVFQLFVKLVLGEFSVCCILFFESQPCCCRCTMNGAEAHTLRTHATPSVAVILRALPAQCVLLGDNRARPCLAMPCRRLRSPAFGFPLPITPLSHSHLLTWISRHPKNAHFSVKSNPGALIVKVRRISCSRSSPNPRSKRCAFYLSLHPTHPIPASRSYQRCCGNPARLRSDRPFLLRSALLSSNDAYSSHFRFRIALLWCRTSFANGLSSSDLIGCTPRSDHCRNRDPILLLTTAIYPPSLDLCPYARKRQCAAQS